MKKYTADKNGRIILRLTTLAVFSVIIPVIAAALPSYRIFMTILLAVCAAILLVGGGLWLPLFLGSLSFEISESEIVYRGGVFFYNRTVMKKSAVRHVTLIRTPFSEFTGMNFVSVSALGGGVILPFLSYSDAKEILSLLTTTGGEE